MQIFISGVSSGIGKEMVQQLIAKGHAVWGIARTRERLETLNKDLGSELFQFSVCDIRNPEQLDQTKKEMASKQFHPDVVILNAGAYHKEDHMNLDPGLITNSLRTNMEGTFNCYTMFIEEMAKRNSGQYIYISSLFALLPDRKNAAYAGAKAGMDMAFRSLKLHFKKTNIQFKIVHLGPIETKDQVKTKFYAPSSSDASRFIIKVMDSTHSVFYFPGFIRFLSVFFSSFPDTFFDILTNRFRR